MSLPGDIAPRHLAALADLHHQVDAQAAPLVRRHAGWSVCRRGCSECCQDDLTVLEIEAAWILAHRTQWAEPEAGPHPPGACAFLAADGSCRVYPWRPYVCRTQGLPLRWRRDPDRPQAGEGRSICPLNERELARAGLVLACLPAQDLWLLGEWEGRLASLQAEATGVFAPARVALRALWDPAGFPSGSADVNRRGGGR